MSENTPKDETLDNSLSDSLDDRHNGFEEAGESTARTTVSEFPAFNRHEHFSKESLEEITKSVAGLQEPMLSDAGPELQAVIQESLRSSLESKLNLQEISDMTSLFANMGGIIVKIIEDHEPMSYNLAKLFDCVIEVRDYVKNQLDNGHDDEIIKLRKLNKGQLEPFEKWIVDELKIKANEQVITIKYLCDKYQQWIENREPTIDKKEFDKCTKMIDCLKIYQNLMENQSDTDDEITKRRKLDEHMKLILKKIDE